MPEMHACTWAGEHKSVRPLYRVGPDTLVKACTCTRTPYRAFALTPCVRTPYHVGPHALVKVRRKLLLAVALLLRECPSSRPGVSVREPLLQTVHLARQPMPCIRDASGRGLARRTPAQNVRVHDVHSTPKCAGRNWCGGRAAARRDACAAARRPNGHCKLTSAKQQLRSPLPERAPAQG
eukprot:366018-Chlamydomonas_euryale.AAC.11